MTGHDSERPDLEQAAEDAAQSAARAAEDSQDARERARRSLGLAERLRRLREENGFQQLFEEAFGG